MVVSRPMSKTIAPPSSAWPALETTPPLISLHGGSRTYRTAPRPLRGPLSVLIPVSSCHWLAPRVAASRPSCGLSPGTRRHRLRLPGSDSHAVADSAWQCSCALTSGSMMEAKPLDSGGSTAAPTILTRSGEISYVGPAVDGDAGWFERSMTTEAMPLVAALTVRTRWHSLSAAAQSAVIEGRRMSRPAPDRGRN